MSRFRQPLLLIMLLSFPFALLCIQGLALSDNDAMFPQIAREMRQAGDWITPRLNGALHFDKPPLVFWLTGLSQFFMGETDAAARLWPAMSCWATILIVGLLGSSLYGKRAGWLSALVFAACVGPHLYSCVVGTDSILCFWCALAVLAYVRAFAVKERCATGWLLLMFASIGLAGLTKSILGMGLPASVIFWHAALSGRLKRFLSWQGALGVLLMAAVFAPWHILMARAHPSFLWHFFMREHVLRFTGQRYPRDEFLSAPAFLAFTYLWVFPWMGILPQALSGAFRRLKTAGWTRGEDLLPFLWCFLVVGLFTASQCRMEYYSLPAVPAFALLIGKALDELLLKRDGRSTVRFAASALCLMSVVLLLAAVGSWLVLGPSKEALFQLMEAWWPGSGWFGAAEQITALERIRIPTVVVLTGSALFVLGAAVSAWFSRPGLACGFIAGIMVPFFIMAHWGFILMEPFMSSRPVAELIRKAEPVNAVVIQRPHEYQAISGMVYYSDRTVYVLEDPELDDPGLRSRDVASRLLTQEKLEEMWKSGARIALVLDRSVEIEASVLSTLGPVDVIGQIGDRVVVANGMVAKAPEPEDFSATSVGRVPIEKVLHQYDVPGAVNVSTARDPG